MLPPQLSYWVGPRPAEIGRILSSLELPSDCMHDPFGSSTTALPVDPKRVSLPTQVGQCQPERWLPPELAWPFTHPERLVLPEELWPDPLPRACHMISVEDELELAACSCLTWGWQFLSPRTLWPLMGKGGCCWQAGFRSYIRPLRTGSSWTGDRSTPRRCGCVLFAGRWAIS